MVRDELERRGEAYAQVAASSITEYRKLANVPGEPRILLLIDGFPAFREDFEVGAGRGVWYDVFRDVLTDGRGLGIHVAFTADRSGAVPSSVRSNVQRNIVLRLADDTYGLFDVRATSSGRRRPGSCDRRRLRGPGRDHRRKPCRRGPGPRDQAPGARHGRCRGPRGTADRVAPEGVRARPPAGRARRASRAGDQRPGPRSARIRSRRDLPDRGRSRLRTDQRRRGDRGAVRRADPSTQTFLVSNPRSPLAGAPGWTDVATSTDDTVALAKRLTALISEDGTERVAVFIEGINDFLQSPADAPLVELVKTVKRHGHLVVAEAESSGWSSAWPLMTEFKNARRGLLLQPDGAESELLLKTPRHARSGRSSR
ncbi:hypothetical protein NKG05_05835 [Oerskovia sp. M15]